MIFLQFGRAIAWVATLFLWIASVLTVLMYFEWTGTSYPGYDGHGYTGHLDPAYLQKVWDYRRSQFGYILWLDFFACTGLLFSVYAIFCLKQILRYASGLWRNLMVYSWLIGCLLPALEFLQNMGAYTQSYDFTAQITQGPDFVPLEISYRVSQASSVWVFSLIYLLLGISILSASWMFWHDDEFQSKPQSILGIVLECVGFIAFATEIAMFFNPVVTALRVMFGVITLFWGVILLPAWLIYLGFRMGRYVAKNIRAATGGDIELEGMDKRSDDVTVESDLSI